MVDVHCHLNFHAFEKDYDEVIKSAFNAGVSKIINVGTKIDSSIKAVELANKYENLYSIIGIHPHHADKLEEGWEKELEILAKSSKKVVAIGEIGMDFFRYKSNGIVDPNIQENVFTKQIELAYKLKLPLQIHNRHAGAEILNILLSHKSSLLNPPGMFHCMSGDLDYLKKVLNLGFYIGFDGNITYKGLPPGETVELKELVKYTPLDKIVTETDSPYLTPQPLRGTKNKPEYVILIGKFIANLKEESFLKVSEQTSINARKIFNI